jgi:hypothetical protein
MKQKWAFFIVLSIFFVITSTWGLMAAGTTDIEQVRNKTVLDDRDFAVIDAFLRQAIGEFLTTKNFTDVARLRTIILKNQKSNQPNQNQYTSQFSKSAHTYISQAFDQALILRPPERQTRVIVNLLILIDNLQDVQLLDLAMGKLNDENMAVRYWAVHAVTNPDIVKKLMSGDAQNRKLILQITEQLKQIVDSSTPEILGLIAQFAGNLNLPQGNELLGQIADLRIQRYADWTVKYERLDIAILELLADKITSSSQSPAGATTTESGKTAMARRFGQLYSFVIERYIKGRNLNITQRQQLVTVMAEIEEKCISKLLGRQENAIRTAVSERDMAALETARARLLSDVLPSKLGYDYGTNPDGSKRTAPLPLPDQPS